MNKRGRLAIIAVCLACLALLLGCGGAPKVLAFSDMKVTTDTRTGFFGGRYASFKVTGSVTNNTKNPINKDNIPAVVWDGENSGKAEVEMSQDKLLAGETCDVSWEQELTIDGSTIPELSFSGSVEFTGLEDAEAQLNEQLQDIAGKYASEDAKKEEEQKAKEQAEAEAAQKVEDDKAALRGCKGKTAYEAYETAKGTDFAPLFWDSYDVDVTDDVKKAASDSEIGSSLVESVEIEDAGWFSGASVTFKLDYVDPTEQKKRDDEAAAEEAQKRVKKSLEDCKGKTADEALDVAEKSPYEPRFEDSQGVDVTDDVEDSSNGSEVHTATVTKVDIQEEGFLTSAEVTFTLDYVDPKEAKKAQARKELENSKGKSAAYALKRAKIAGLNYSVEERGGRDVTEDVKDEAYRGALKRVKVRSIDIDTWRGVIITINRPLAMTVEDNEELRQLLELHDNFDPAIKEFAKKYQGKNIEFDGCFSSLYTEGSGRYARYTILVEAMDYDPDRAIGPTFQFRDMTISSMNWVGEDPSSLHEGQNVHVVARLGEFNAKNGLYQLTPLRMSFR